MKNIDNIKLKRNATIKDALTIIDKGAMQIALIVDNDNKLLGTLTDGDIRRGLLKGLDLNSPIDSIIFKTPTIAKISDSKEDILKIALSKKLHQIPVLDENNIILGIQEIEELIKPEKKDNKVVLMVGGLGTRLRPLTDNIPKPMLKVGNKPILETIIINFKKYGFVNIILCVSYKAEIIEEYFGDGSSFGVNIEYIHENKRMGTAGALSLIKDKLDKDFFVMNGDLLTNINFEYMMAYHMSNNSTATMGVREYDFQVPYGVVNLDNENIISIDEKPIQKFFVSGGVYILGKEVLNYIPDDKFYDMPSLFETLIKENKKSISFPIREYWLDIGRLEEYEKANNEYNKVF